MTRQAAPKPPARTVTIELKGAFAGWTATAKADFRAGVLADLQSGAVQRVIDALDEIIVDHNFPGAGDDVATSMAMVEPYEGLVLAGIEIITALGKLPNR